MEWHKLRINKANAITIAQQARQENHIRALRIGMCSVARYLLVLGAIILLAENFLAATCNKFNENPSSLSRTPGNNTNYTTAMVAINAISAIHGDLPNTTQNMKATQEVYKYMAQQMLQPHWPSASIIANRAKRYILFNGGGVVKLVLGASFPMQLPDKQRSLSSFYNLQILYTPPPRPIYWWSTYNTSTFPVRSKWRRMAPHSTSALHRDRSREFLYGVIEKMLIRDGFPGMPCLLRAICEISSTPFSTDDDAYSNQYGHDGTGNIFHTLLNAIFAPTLPNVDAKYLSAHRKGYHGADCSNMFKACPSNANWLKQISQFV